MSEATRTRHCRILLPIETGLAVFEQRDRRTVEIAPVPAIDLTKARLSDDGQFLGVVDLKGKRGTLYAVGESGLERVAAPANLPRGTQTSVIALRGANLYAAGNDYALWRLDIAEGKSTWSSIPLPPLLDRKDFDELLVDSTRLIAVDNIVFPKYLVVYDISDPTRPTPGAPIELPSHSTYEQIRAAALGDRWVVILSGGVGRCGTTMSMSLLDKATLQERYCYNRFSAVEGCDPGFYGIEVLDESEGLDESASSEDKMETPLAVAFAADRLFVASESAGVGVLSLGDVDAALVEPPCQGAYAKPGPKIQYFQLQKPVTDVVTAPGLDGCYTIFEDRTWAWFDPSELPAV